MNDLINLQLARKVIETAVTRGIQLTTAESCTGGLIGGALTSVAGSSAAYDGGFVTYSNEAKRDFLGVNWDLLCNKGAVSAEVSEAMAKGAMQQTVGRTSLAVSVTGIAGPGGGSLEKPVGLVYFGLATAKAGQSVITTHYKHIFREHSREAIRMRTVETALTHLLTEMV